MSDNLITDAVFQHTAKLSRLEIKPEESYIKDQLAQAAQYVEVLKELNTDNVPPTYQVNHKSNVLREDVVNDSLSQDLALSQAENTTDAYFKTAPTINKNK
ncbi:MAG: Aspartyl/glutamyl-tRNA(Asn/Gln) amidotransferase subunit C [Candidatus Shapirobacteria bacterium GW2011_GWE1_38_10]|uniref:Aspartyl/glutamyl-tRNA(Asn/Gln) amidotransferase subunit C n=1 Tax=Candidatus Shapirobacteria bacterium GW2011_GWE1_38_10 TaxID=1618488 RepID=A0A0G0I3M2_9BACT|nr:MAG: Aspartyl/glutamyl-tRNA(Asn/Gln) amidotransferase subunit C [Candidatus Shapirobacteria bacterium GW2011_GWF2_37_20]KKQ49938.1 MAG: Aspartyl/glutamyl-tRNA(Asn/Gln) amidotransferase subunit C [Candidatus Shapirobacteria bacterium GW2011_GWE1_38_10]KKQ63101.1 MAG: Aspartyl/glutamyl-tRNA(Asn/Gln) amidotransferase subunit C [Candidatus Shapirobacteria bacterium GW2011_GWF1_38_23]HBP51519.1 Asp-tRNA(Asn)/Glu-tRNA(Gln) amidotransferase GatCAB subunit C [Candidatus Shapirobacteria bacterium]